MYILEYFVSIWNLVPPTPNLEGTEIAEDAPSCLHVP